MFSMRSPVALPNLTIHVYKTNDVKKLVNKKFFCTIFQRLLLKKEQNRKIISKKLAILCFFMRIWLSDSSIIIWLYFVQFFFLFLLLKVGEERNFIHHFHKRKAFKSLLNTAPRQGSFSVLSISWVFCYGSN